jgi:phosphate transport system permease protein
MSQAHATETTLVTGESNRYDRILDATIALSIVSFVIAILTTVGLLALTATGSALVDALLLLLGVASAGVGSVALLSWANVVPVTSRRVQGIGVGIPASLLGLTVLSAALPVSMATLLGIALVVQAVTIAGAGLVSSAGVVDTVPSTTAGLLAGGAFGAVGLVLGAVLGGTVIGSTAGWIGIALLGGIGLFVATTLPDEDLGTTVPAAIVLGILGATIVTRLLHPGWQWVPGGEISGGFTGGVVIPMFVLFGSLVSSWAGAKCRAGFGAEGRQYGAFFLINLNAFLMIVIMVSVVAFVVQEGVVYAAHDLQVGALTLLMLLTPLLLLAIDWARRPAGTTEWHSAARQTLRVLPIAGLGSVGAALLGILATGTTITVPFTYTVLENRAEKTLDTSLAVTPDLTVGAWILALPAAVIAVGFFKGAGSLRTAGSSDQTVVWMRQTLSTYVIAAAGLAILLTAFGPSPLGIPVAAFVGGPLVAIGAAGALGLVALPILRPRIADGPAGPVELSPTVAVGAYGGLAALAGAVLLEATTEIVPWVLGIDLVALAAIAGAGIALAHAWRARRGRSAAPTERARRLCGTQLSIWLGVATGFVSLVGFHVALTGSTVSLLGPAVATQGSLSWPFVMEASIPLAPDSGGIFPAVMGTVWLVIGASAFAIPLGVGAAIFLTEYAEQGIFTGIVEVATNALWSTPSVVFGLFGAAFLIPRFGQNTSLLSGMLVLGFMLLPLVLITSREAIKAVPDEYRDASAALGVDRWETIRSVVLPAAMPGVITGVILGVGRIAGETAPLILVLGSKLNAPAAVDVLGGFRLLSQPPFIVNEAVLSESPALPTGIWAIITAGVSGSTSRGWGTAFVLLTVVLLFYAVGIATRTYFRRKVSHE